MAIPALSDVVRQGVSAFVASGGVVAPVATRIRRAANQAIPNGAGWTDLVYDTSSYQANGAFWTSGATITIPETGYYQVFSEATFDGSGLIGTVTANMQVLVNGATVIGDDEKQVLVNATAALFVMAQRFFTAGDTIKVQVKHSNASAVNVLAQGDHSPDIIVTALKGAKGDSGAATVTRHEVDFGSAPRDAVTVDLVVTGVTAGQRVVASPSLEMPLGVDQDEFEMDPISVAAHATATDTVRVIVSSRHPIQGKRAINVMR